MKLSDLKQLPPISIPVSNLRLSEDEDGNLKVFDPIRKKEVALTPEEWVRQNFVQWLIDSKGYPASRIANEVKIDLNDTRKRCDTVAFGLDCRPLIIVEYKAPTVEITQNTFDQIVRYNMKLKAKYLIVSNGVRNYCCVINYQSNSYNFIPHIPDYTEAEGMPMEN